MSTPAASPRERLLSLDIFRGLCVIGMMLVDWPGSWDAPRLPLFEHTRWNGVSPADYIFPAFLFIMGVAVPFSFGSKKASGVSAAPLYPRIFRRALLLFLLGMILNLSYMVPGPIDLGTLRVAGVLNRYALVYPVVALFYLHLPDRRLPWVAAGLLLSYWAMMTLIRVPGFGPPDLALYPTGEATGNLACWVDKTLMGRRVYEYPCDPEGLLSTLPSIATALLGVVAGLRLRGPLPKGDKAASLMCWGVLLVVAGYFWGVAFPLNKKLWTSSFAALMAGWDLLFLGALYWVIDIRGHRGRWLTLPRWFGVNALGGIVAFTLIDAITRSIPVGYDGQHARLYLKDWLFSLLTPRLPERHASWVYSVAAILLLSLLFRSLEKRKLFLKV